MLGPFKPQGCARAAGMQRIPGNASIPSAVDPYPDFPVTANLVDAWLANLAYMFTNTACTSRVTAAAQRVLGWRGRLGNIFAQAVSDDAPVSDLTSGIWSLEFDSADTRSMAVTVAVAQPITIYTVAFQDNAVGTSYQYDGLDSANRNACLIDVSGNPTIFAGAGPVGPPASMPAQPYAFACVFNGALSSIRSSASTIAAIDAGTNGVAGYTLGARFNLTQFFSKRFRAMLVYSAAHNTTVQDTILAWLRTNFGAN